MVSQNSTENNSEKLSTPTPPTPIPDSISIPAVSISTPSQISREEATIATEEIGKSTNNKEPSSDKNKKNNKKKSSVATQFSYKSIADFAHCIKTDDYLLEDATVTRELGQLTGTTERYMKEKAAIIKRFFEILSKNKVLGFLAQAIEDPQDKHLQTTIFYEQLRGIKTSAKYTVLNSAMCWFAINFKKLDKKYGNIKLTDKIWTKEHAAACYESTTTSQRIKELFVEFHEQGIIYGTNDFLKKRWFQ